MDVQQVMRRRLMYRLEDSNGNHVPHQGYETAILETVRHAVPSKEVSFREEDILIDLLTKDERLALETAVSANPELSNRKLKNFNMIFCEMNGAPVKGKARFWELANEQNRLTSAAFEAKYGPDADEDDVIDW